MIFMEKISQDNNLFKRIEAQENAARQFGFYWSNIDELITQIQSECIEIQEAWQSGEKKHLEEEIGDLLLASISLAIFCDLDPQITLCKSTEKFQKRYNSLVELAHTDGYSELKQQSVEVLMSYWKRAKQLSI